MSDEIKQHIERYLSQLDLRLEDLPETMAEVTATMTVLLCDEYGFNQPCG